MFLEAISGIIAIYIAYQAHKAYDFSKERTFLTFALSFSILGASSMMRDLLILTSVLGPARALVRPYSIIGDALQAFVSSIAYSLLLWRQASTFFRAEEEQRKIAGQLLLIIMTLSFNVLNVLILLAMTLILLLRYSEDRETNQLLVAGAFSLIAASHLSNLLGLMVPQLLAIETFLRLCGYFLLLIMLRRVGTR